MHVINYINLLSKVLFAVLLQKNAHRDSDTILRNIV